MATSGSPGSHDRGARRGRTTFVAGDVLVQPTARQERLALNLSVPEGYSRCPECGKQVRNRKDGTMQAHRSQSTIPCIGAEPR